MVQFAAHGSHKISWEGDVMVLNLGSLFNREGVEQVLAQVTDDLQKRGDSPRGDAGRCSRMAGRHAGCFCILAGIAQCLD